MNKPECFNHSNGYNAMLYGKSSLSVYDADGKEVLHTGFRNANTKEEVMAILERMPDFVEAVRQFLEESDMDDEEEVTE